MKLLLWVLGFFGFGIAFVGCFHGMRCDYSIDAAGRSHAPTTFVLMGIFVLLVGIWVSLLALVHHKKTS